MTRKALRRLAVLPPMLLAVSAVAFLLASFLPTEPEYLIAGDSATEAELAQVRADLGTDKPLLVQYGQWLAHAVRGDLGTSYYSTAAVADQVLERLTVTMYLAGGALAVALITGVVFGVIAALYRGTVIDRVLTVVATIGTATPAFWLGLILMTLFAVRLGWFPATGYVKPSVDVGAWLSSIALPCISLGFAASAVFLRQTRSAMIGVLSKEYVRTAVASGLPRSRVIFKYSLKNALVPVLTVTSFQFTHLIGGALVVEKVFAVPGLGDLAITSVLEQDVPVLQGIVMVSAVLVLLVNLALDIAYTWLNPKVGLS